MEGISLSKQNIMKKKRNAMGGGGDERVGRHLGSGVECWSVELWAGLYIPQETKLALRGGTAGAVLRN